MLKRKQKVAEQVVKGDATDNEIRQVQKSTVVPPKQRTQEDIMREIEASKASYAYEKQDEQKKTFTFHRDADLDALLKRKQKVASREVSQEVSEDAIRQVQKSTVVPPKQRTQEDIMREIEASKASYTYEKPEEQKKKYEFHRDAELDALLKRKQKVASQEVSQEVNEDAIRQVQKSTVIPPKQRTQEDILREIEASKASYAYEKPDEQKKKYEFHRDAELDALLKRKQKVASVEVQYDEPARPAVPSAIPSAPPSRRHGAAASKTPAFLKSASSPEAKKEEEALPARSHPIVIPTSQPRRVSKPRATQPVSAPVSVPEPPKDEEDSYLDRLLRNRASLSGAVPF